MSSSSDLNDINQAVIYIPYSGQEDDANDDIFEPSFDYPYKYRDLDDGYALRMKAYRIAWTQCLERIQSIVQALHAPIVDAVVQHVHQARSDILPGLPYPEVPVVALTSPIVGLSVLSDIVNRLGGKAASDTDSNGSSTQGDDVFIVHLYPAECTNLMLAMKALIGGFVKKPPNGQEDKTSIRSAASLANYDIELLAAWFEAVRKARGDDALPQLMVVLWDFEQFNTAVVQDIFYICSLQIRRIPLVFILSLSTPPSPSYLRSTYPRSTLALLRIRHFTVPSDAQVLEEILLKTFFDINFEPDIIIGPTVLSFLVEHFNRHHPSVDAILTALQIAYMKHFEEPLTVFAHDSLVGTFRTELAAKKLLQPSSLPFLKSVSARLSEFANVPSDRSVSQWQARNVSELLSNMDDARIQLKTRARRMRVSFKLMRTIQTFMSRHGHGNAESERSLSEMMIAAMKGRLGGDAKYLGMMVKKVSHAELTGLLDELSTFFKEMPLVVWQEDEEDVSKLIAWMADMPSDQAAPVANLARDVGEWLAEHFRTSMSCLEESALWDVWYTGMSPFPSEMINPSIRASIISGLLHPFDYVDYDPSSSPNNNEKRTNPEIWELPDTSILFRRYLDSGKMINVHDWFESFSVVLEDQKRRRKPRRDKGKGKSVPSPAKSSKSAKYSPTRKNGRRRAIVVESSEEESAAGDDADDEDKWKMEVQARFMRALHELDYLGFIKRTGRKADHVLKVVFDTPD